MQTYVNGIDEPMLRMHTISENELYQNERFSPKQARIRDLGKGLRFS